MKSPDFNLVYGLELFPVCLAFISLEHRAPLYDSNNPVNGKLSKVTCGTRSVAFFQKLT